MGKFLVLLAVASCAFASNAACAADVQVVVTQATGSDAVLASWDQGQEPDPIGSVAGYYTTVSVWNATGLGGDTAVTWYSSDHLGGFTNYSELFNVLATQAYTGTESTPFFQPGTYYGVNLYQNLTYVPVDFTISLLTTAVAPAFMTFDQSLPPVPEPATWATFLIGLGMIGFVTRGRHVRLART